MPAITPVTSLDLEAKKVLVRCDFNVPIESGKIADPTRIEATLHTIRYVLGQGASAVLCSHLGRPRGRAPELSLKPVAEYLSSALAGKVALAEDCIGEVTLGRVNGLKPGQALLLENLRFHPEEEANDADFAHELARGKQAYVNDAFGAAHRAHASIVGVTRFLHLRAAGFLMMREIEALRAVTENPAHPYVLILGGVKVSDKIGLIRNLMTKVDAILLAGAMAYTFLKARGLAVGRSPVEEDKLGLARELMDEAAGRGLSLVLPCDHVVASEAKGGVPARVVAQIPADMIALDIGPRTVDEFIAHLSNAKTVVWNGPLGMFELEPFFEGTLRVGAALATSGATSLIGGGDSAAALGRQPWSSRFTHISTGGGATLEYLEGRELPGIKALEG